MNSNVNINTNTNTNQDFNSIYASLLNQLTSNQNIGCAHGKCEESPIGIQAVVDESEPIAAEVSENAEGKIIHHPPRPTPRPQSSSSNYNSNYNYNQNSNYDYNSIFASLFEQLKNQQTINIEKPNKPVHNYEKWRQLPNYWLDYKV